VIEIVRKRTLKAPVDRVWELIEPVERLPQWFVGTDTALPLHGRGLGRKQRVGGTWGSRRFEIDQTVTQYEPRRRLAWRHDAERLDGKAAPMISREVEFSIQLDALKDGTRVQLSSRHVPDGVLKGLIIRLVAAPGIARMMERSLDRMTVMLGRMNLPNDTLS
jgi:uncharacterized protein YndB with AHSA1/START domain